MKTTKISILILSLHFLCFMQINALGQGVGASAPDFTLSTVSGDEFTLSDHTGKVVFLFFFGYACSHCLANGNNTETGIYDAFESNSDFVALGIDTWDGSKSGVENFINQTGITYPVAMNGSSVQSSYSTTYDRIIVIDQSGTIQFKATSNATSSVVSDAKQVIESLLTTTSTNHFGNKEQSLRIYPIPAKESIFIDNPDAQIKYSNFEILNLSGQIILSSDLNYMEPGEAIELPLNGLDSGIYLLRLNSEKNSYTKRFIVTH